MPSAFPAQGPSRLALRWPSRLFWSHIVSMRDDGSLHTRPDEYDVICANTQGGGRASYAHYRYEYIEAGKCTNLSRKCVRALGTRVWAGRDRRSQWPSRQDEG